MPKQYAIAIILPSNLTRVCIKVICPTLQLLLAIGATQRQNCFVLATPTGQYDLFFATVQGLMKNNGRELGNIHFFVD